MVKKHTMEDYLKVANRIIHNSGNESGEIAQSKEIKDATILAIEEDQALLGEICQEVFAGENDRFLELN